MCQRLEVLRTVNDVLLPLPQLRPSTLSRPPTRWYNGLAHYQQSGVAHVLATVVAVNGSAPRALQAKMVITQESCCDTIGGGGLEHDVVTTARQLLNSEIDLTVSKEAKQKKGVDDDIGSEQAKKAIRRDTIYTKHYPLGAKLAQCCGGSVTVMFECFNVTPPLSLLVFGAGHVAAALMTILAELPCQVDWVDSRPEMFEPYLFDKSQQDASEPQEFAALSTSNQHTLYKLPAHIRPHITEDPVDFIEPFIKPFIKQNKPCFILIMTHDHALDFELVRAAIDVTLANNKKDDSIKSIDIDNAISKISLPYIGCIGSATKAKRFKDRLLQRGYSQQTVEQLAMPIGLPIGGKEPMAVAVSIAAQILQHYNQQ